MNRCSMPQVVMVCVASVAACFLAGAKVGLYLYDRYTKG